MADFKIHQEKFNRFVNELADGMDTNGKDRVARAMALRFIDFVANAAEVEGVKTPVDTGRARAGWAAFADAQGHHVDFGATEGVAEGRKESSYTDDEGYIGIRNAVPYIEALEYGSSDQAPGGFVRLNLERMRTGVTGDALAALRDEIAEANVKARAMGLKFKGKK